MSFSPFNREMPSSVIFSLLDDSEHMARYDIGMTTLSNDTAAAVATQL